MYNWRRPACGWNSSECPREAVLSEVLIVFGEEGSGEFMVV